MKRFSNFALAAVLLLTSSLVQAAGLASSVYVTQIESLANGVFFVYFSSPATGSPTCVGNSNAFAFDSTTAQGKTLVSIIEVAYVQGTKVTSGGVGTCAVYSGYETLSYIITN